MKPLTQAIRALDAYDPDALPVADALRIIRGCVTPVPMIERIALRSALGRVLAEDIVSPFDVPAHDNTAMDGWAVRHADLATEGETVLRQIGEAFAGHPYTGAVGAGECVRVMTGAVLPTGTDCIVVQEVVRVDARGVCVPPGQRAGQHLRYRGEDLARGKPCVNAGCVLGPAHIGLLASLGLPEVPVRRRLRVAFFSTGDELVSIGEPLAPGAIYDSNRYTLHGMLTRLGCEVHDLGVVRDDPAALEAALAAAAADADVVITTGGVSVGEADFTRAILARLGEAAFWKIAMRPGRPLAFGRVGACTLLRPARQPGRGNDHLLPVRARGLARRRRRQPRQRTADVAGTGARRHPQETRPHRVSACHRRAGCPGPVVGSPHWAAGLGGTQFHGAGQLPDRAGARARLRGRR